MEIWNNKPILEDVSSTLSEMVAHFHRINLEKRETGGVDKFGGWIFKSIHGGCKFIHVSVRPYGIEGVPAE
jgi:hypothetical protein